MIQHKLRNPLSLSLIAMLLLMPLYPLEDPAKDIEPENIPPSGIELTPTETPKQNDEGKWKTIGMVILSVAMITVGLVVASSNEGKKV
ncbi:MAG: hypothetical protein WDZ28_01820 [Simkaniaceae bacterium]